MSHIEESAGWRLFGANWMMLSIMTVMLAAGMALTGFSIAPASALKPVVIISAYAGYTFYKQSYARNGDPRVAFILGSTGQLLLIPVLMTPLTYIAAAANLPMQDVALNALDRALGLDWMAYFNFVYDRHALMFATVLAYSMIGWPVFGVPIALGWTGRYRRMQQFTLAFGIALVATTVISTLVPAMGTYELFNYTPDPKIFTPGAYLEQLRDLPMVRNGALRVIDFGALTGIVTFPSFHAAAAVLYLWAFWPLRWLGPIALIVNVAMLLATPICGGHYFADVFAGIAIAVLAIIAARWIAEWLIQPAKSNAALVPEVAIPAE
ncbi:MAG TPA: phosphatase PAP2 family protein [Pseudolabrys sp.]|nr:phosphatase PAP2 family protein [Pseudolabrys sp.]